MTRIGNSHFLYDGVSRIKRGSVWDGRIPSIGSSRIQDFTHDAFGNLTSIVGSNGAPGRSIPVSAATNRLGGWSNTYDAAGNLTMWSSGPTYQYGPFNDMWSMKNGAEDWLYIYTADDQRLWSYRLSGDNSRWTLRDLNGKVLREYNVSTAGWTVNRDYVYRNGQLLAAHTNEPSPAHILHYHADHLGTPRLITRNDRVLYSFHAYYPFGEEATAFNQNTERAKFTGHERDLNNPTSAADDLDYMHARFYNPQLGRFLSTDPKNRYRPIREPQRYNRYAYAINNPMRMVDPDGREAITFTITTQIRAARAFAPIPSVPPIRAYSGGVKTSQTFTIETSAARSARPIVSAQGSLNEVERRSLFSNRVLATAQGTGGVTVGGGRDSAGNVLVVAGALAGNALHPGAPPITLGVAISAPEGGSSFSVSGSFGGYPSLNITATNEAGEAITVYQSVEPGGVLGPFLLFPGLGDQVINVHCDFGTGCKEPPRE